MVLALVNNDGAEFSHDTMTTVDDRSETSDVLCKPLLNRKDLPPDLMHNMFWWVGAELKNTFLPPRMLTKRWSMKCLPMPNGAWRRKSKKQKTN